MFNFIEQFSFYGSYHQNIWNKLIHIVCVPCLLWTTLVWLSNTGPLPLLTTPITSVLGLETNAGLIISVIYGLYYICLERPSGFLAFVLIMIASKTASEYRLKDPDANSVVLLYHVGSWMLQFAGHSFAEGRAPALFDNLLQSFILAPFFVFMEVLFFFGYKPDLRKATEREIKKKLDTP